MVNEQKDVVITELNSTSEVEKKLSELELHDELSSKIEGLIVDKKKSKCALGSRDGINLKMRLITYLGNIVPRYTIITK